MIYVRTYKDSDAQILRRLFYDTVHAINQKDYSQSQCDAWAPVVYDEKEWANNLKHNYTLVAQIDNEPVGFADMDRDGYVEHLFVHKDFQGKGIAKALIQAIEKEAQRQGFKELRAEVSITAQPFFEKAGFIIVKKQHKKHRGEIFINYIMIKGL